MAALAIEALIRRTVAAHGVWCEAVRAAGYADEWCAYRADNRGEAWPPSLIAAHRAYMDDLHAEQHARFGPKGVLGGVL